MTKTYDLDALPGSLLTTRNPKTTKSEKSGYLTAIMHFAPAKLSGFNVCAYASKGCTLACLNTAGRGGMDDSHYENILNGIQVARIQRTRWFRRDKEAFMIQLADEIAAHVQRAIRHGLTPAVRLNGTSDIKWEDVKLGAFRNIFAMFPDVQFYDYTKWPIHKRRAISNYHLTFSLSESNDAHAADALALAVNVAVAFDVKKSDPLPPEYTIDGITAPVIDGDLSDLRFTDKRVSIVGLRAKGARGKADTSGFVRATN